MQYCNNNKKAIIIVRGNDTDFNNASFLTIRLTTEILDLSTFKAVFKLGNIVKYFNDLSSGKMVINFNATETACLLSECYGTLNLIDTSGKIATIENRIPFEVISVVDGNAIATEPYTFNFDVKQGGENILNVSVESAVTVELGTTTTLPAGSDAIVTNSGTFNHLVLNFGIPKGQDGLTPTWGNITGDITEQTDLINLLNEKVDIADFNDLSTTVTNNYNELSGNIANLTITVTDNYNTLSGQISDLTGVVNDNYTSLNNRLTTAEGSILDLTDTVNDNYTELNGKIIVNAGDIATIQNSINSYGDIVTYDAAYFATANQGALADTSLQPNDNITLLNNNAGYITISALDGFATEDYVNNQGFITADALNGYATEQWVNNKGYITGIDNSDVVTALGYTPYNASNPAGYITAASLPTVNNNTITIQKNGVNVDSFTLNQNSNKSINITVPTNNNELINGAGYITSADIPTLADLTTTAQLAAINSGATSTNIGQIATNTQNIVDEVTNRQNADNGLQSQIDAIVSSSDVFDIVGTYAELQAYDISTVPVNDIIKVLVDSTHSNAATYYRCVESGGVKSWSYIGSEGAYYTKSEADGRFVVQTITVNGQPLSSNVSLTASDVGALPDNTVIPTVNNSTITIQKNSTTVDTFTLNQSSAKTINISVPTDTSDLTNGAGYITGITSGDVTTALGYTPYNSSNPNGYISGITSTDVTTALGYTPYNSTNPSGYITSSDLTNYVTTNTAQDITARKTFIGEKAIYFKQTADNNKLGFTLYDKDNKELGGLEFRPNTISGKALLAINCPQSGSSSTIGDNYVGFRYWANINIVAPRPTTNGTYYMTVGISDGTNKVTTTSNGILDISTLYQKKALVTSISSTSTDNEYPSAKCVYDLIGDIETILHNINSGS